MRSNTAAIINDSLGPRCKAAMLRGKTKTKARKKAVLIQLMEARETP
jgi:hypothetical protein